MRGAAGARPASPSSGPAALGRLERSAKSFEVGRAEPAAQPAVPSKDRLSFSEGHEGGDHLDLESIPERAGLVGQVAHGDLERARPAECFELGKESPTER